MSDHINNDLTNDIAIAAAVRTFLSSPAILSVLQACVTEAANAEVQRLTSSDRILDTVWKALNNPATAAESRLYVSVEKMIRDETSDATRYFLNEDSARDFIRDELESGPRYFTRAVESAVENTIDTDSIADTVKDKVSDDLDLDSDIADKVIDYFNDDDNLHSVTKRVIESISITITPSRSL